jgi:hypothetical protein
MPDDYCLHCKKDTKDVAPKIVTLKNGRHARKSKCAVCGFSKFRFVASQKGGNPALVAVAQAIPGSIGAIGDTIVSGVKANHEFNKENGNLTVQQEQNFQRYFRDLQHQRYWDPERIPASLRLKKFGIDPPSAMKDPKNADKLEKADDALYAYAEKRFYKN